MIGFLQEFQILADHTSSHELQELAEHFLSKALTGRTSASLCSTTSLVDLSTTCKVSFTGSRASR